MTDKQMKNIISELIEIEKDENAHGIDQEGNVNWDDGVKQESYFEYVKMYCDSKGIDFTNKEVQEIHGRVLAEIM